MSVLSIVQAAMARTNKPRPSTVVGNQDPLVAHFLALLEELGQETVLRMPGGRLKANKSGWTAPGTQVLGTFDSLFGDAEARLIDRTFYDLSTKLMIAPWQSDGTARSAAVIGVNPGIYNWERIGANLVTFPAIPVGTPLTVDYYTTNWVAPVAGVPRSIIVSDSDIPLLPEQMLIVGLRAKWLAEKGLAYAEQQRSFEMMLLSYQATLNTPRPLNLNQGAPLEEARPRVVVPQGPWSLP